MHETPSETCQSQFDWETKSPSQVGEPVACPEVAALPRPYGKSLHCNLCVYHAT